MLQFFDKIFNESKEKKFPKIQNLVGKEGRTARAELECHMVPTNRGEDVSPWRKERKLATVCNESAKRERISGSGKFAWLESCNLREKGITRETT